MQITYGRYTECFKQKVQLDYWGECVDLFEQKKYFDCFKIFTKYISNRTIRLNLILYRVQRKLMS